mgnify:CR=1 FL=1
MTNSCEKGRSMIEMLGVLAIVGVLSVGGIAGYSKAMGKYKTNHLIEQLTMLITNIRNSFIGQHDFSDINNNLLINIGAVPADMYDHSRASNDILHAWNGKVTIFPSEASNNKQMAFELYVNNISKNVCIEMVTMDWGKEDVFGGVFVMVFFKSVTFFNQLLILRLEAIRNVFQENQSENDGLVFGCVDVSAQDASRVPDLFFKADVACAILSHFNNLLNCYFNVC